MSIQISCTLCGTKYNVNPSVIGKRLKCKDCGQAFVATTTQPLPNNVPPPLPPPPVPMPVMLIPPPLPAISAIPAIPISADAASVSSDSVSLVNWLLGVNLGEQIAVALLIVLMVMAFVIGGDTGAAIGGGLSFLIVLYFAFAAYMMARTAGQNGYGIVQMLIPFYIIPFAIEHWPVMKWPVARMSRIVGLFFLIVLVFIRSRTGTGMLSPTGSVASANTVRGGNAPTFVSPPMSSKPTRKITPKITPGNNSNPPVARPPVMVESPKVEVEQSAESRARAEARRYTSIMDTSAPPLPIEAAIPELARPTAPIRSTGGAPRTMFLGPIKLKIADARVLSSGMTKDYWLYRIFPAGQDLPYILYAETVKENPNGATVPALKTGDIVGRQPRLKLGDSLQVDQVEINDKPFTRLRENDVDRCYSCYIDGYRISVFYAGATSPAAGQAIRQMLDTMEVTHPPR